MRPYPSNEKKFRMYYPWNTTTNVCLNYLKILKKVNEVWKSRDLSWCDGVTRRCCDKKLRRFRTLYHDDVYKIEISQKKYMCDCIWELVDVFFEYKLFYMISYVKKSSYQSRAAWWNLKLCSCQLLYLRLFNIFKYYYKLFNLKS